MVAHTAAPQSSPARRMSAAEIAGLPFALRHNRSGQDVPADLGGPGRTAAATC